MMKVDKEEERNRGFNSDRIVIVFFIDGIIISKKRVRSAIESEDMMEVIKDKVGRLFYLSVCFTKLF